MFAYLMKVLKKNKLLPRISDTEREALVAGTVWIEGDFFAGSPNFQKILKEPYHQLSKEEQEFLKGPVEELCQMIDPEKVATSKKVPASLVEFMKAKGFFGLLIPKKYGGLEFSALAISQVIQKVMPRSAIVGVMIIIPNSLGAAELLVAYGTESQKNHYLPKLANGDYIPCFALTETTAGSDAASMKSTGEVFRDDQGQLKIRLNFEKRYISMAPVSNLISLAIKLKDPQNLLGKGEDVGITVVLLHKSHQIQIGKHHEPIGDPFYNGPIEGKNVVIGVDQIIGELEYAGKGWKMLMEQLGGGRAISLPAGAVGGMKSVTAAAGAYSQVRSQFNIPIGKMEGIRENLAMMAALTYAFDATRIFSCSAVDSGQEPPVVSAVLKVYSTEICRKMLEKGMDIFAGSGVMKGPKNILGRGFAAAPVGITVEGANILTRTLIIFGQGSTRCHPYSYQLIRSVEEANVEAFRKNILGWFTAFFLGLFQKSIRTMTRGVTVPSPIKGQAAKYFRRLGWSAACFSMLTNLAIFTLGGRLKIRGSLTGRYADAIAWQLVAVSSLRRFVAEGQKKEDLPLVCWSCEYALYQVQKAFEGIYQNFDVPFIGWYMRTMGSWLLRLNPVGVFPSDQLSEKAAKTLQSFSEQFKRLISGIYVPDSHEEGLGHLLHTFHLIQEAEPIFDKIKRAQKKKRLPKGVADELLKEALEVGIISEEEAKKLEEVSLAKAKAIAVDAYTPAQFFEEDSVKIAPGFEV